ncbi:MAG: hypothetical protein V1807_03125 [Patescibacteria group bacterium]
MKKEQREKLDLAKDILLGIAGVGGVLVVALTAPGAIGLLKPLLKKYKRRAQQPGYIQQRFRDLEAKGLIAISERGDKTKITLTQLGKKQVLEYRVDTMELDIPLRWDGKWRIVIFDIPESRKTHRDAFRRKLIDLGFEHIQDSVWRHKYPCSKEIEFLAHLYEIYPYVDMIEGKMVKL